jgi:hypothetical protein
MMALVNMLMCLARGAGVAEGSIDGAADGSGVGVDEGELIGLAAGDGEGDRMATGIIGLFAPPAKAAENTGLNARIAEMIPVVIAGARII